MENSMAKRIVVINNEEKLLEAHNKRYKVIAEKYLFNDKDRDYIANKIRSFKNEDVLYKAYLFSEDKVYVEILKVEN